MIIQFTMLHACAIHMLIAARYFWASTKKIRSMQQTIWNVTSIQIDAMKSLSAYYDLDEMH